MTPTPLNPNPYAAPEAPRDPQSMVEETGPTDHEASHAEIEDWLSQAQDPQPAGLGGRAVLGWALAILGAAWLGYAGWSAGRSLAGEPLASPLLAQWIAIVAGPLALIGLAWLTFGRTRRREAEAFSRSVRAMQSEARALEGLLSVLRARIDENHGALRSMTNQLMGLGEETAQRLGSVTAELGEGSRQLLLHGEALDRAAQAARVDMGVLLDDLPRAEASARSMAEMLRSSGSQAASQAAAFEAQVAALAERGAEADRIVTDAAQRLAAHLVDIESKGTAAATRLGDVAVQSNGTIDALLQRAAEALEDIRGGIEVQSSAVTALVRQAEAGLDKVGLESADALNSRLALAGGSLDSLSTRLAEQDEASQRMIAGIGESLSKLDGHFALFADMGDQRAASVSTSLDRVRTELDAIASRSGDHDSALHAMGERLASLRSSLDGLTLEVQDQLAGALGEAEGGASRLLDAARTAAPVIAEARDAAVEAGTRLEQGAGAIESQHDRLAALLSAVDTGVGGAERRLAELSEAIGKAEGEATRLSNETGPALVQAMVQVREAASHAAERAREAIAGVIPQSTDTLSASTREALERVVRETVAEQMAAVEAAAARAVEAAQGASQRLTQQMLSIGQSASALDHHFTQTAEAQRERDSETFARRVSLLIDSMHSASIDVQKILSDEVDDKAWASYMKGDRGVFTRRAVRLIGGNEAKALASHYDTDREFQDSVNRYVHDFEAMLRRVGAERDGGPIAVALMSSDMGKLYTALAGVVPSRR